MHVKARVEVHMEVWMEACVEEACWRHVWMWRHVRRQENSVMESVFLASLCGFWKPNTTH